MLQNFNDMPATLVQGDTIMFNFVAKNIEQDEEFDEIVFSVKNNYEDENPVVESTLANTKIARVDYDSTTKKAVYVVVGDAEDTADLIPNTYAYYDIRFRFNGSSIETMLRGRLRVLPAISEIQGE